MSSAYSGRITFTAASPGLSSAGRARYTLPIPPLPSSPSGTYGPRRPGSDRLSGVAPVCSGAASPDAGEYGGGPGRWSGMGPQGGVLSSRELPQRSHGQRELTRDYRAVGAGNGPPEKVRRAVPGQQFLLTTSFHCLFLPVYDLPLKCTGLRCFSVGVPLAR